MFWLWGFCHMWYLHKTLLLHCVEVFASLFMCHNLNIGFVTKCEMQGPMRPKICLGVKHTLRNGGECKVWSPMTPKCAPTLGVALVRELQMFGALVVKENKYQLGPQETIRKVLKHRCLKCYHIVHIDLVYMSYDQNKGHESNWKIWFPTTNPLKLGVKWPLIEGWYTTLKRSFWGL